MSSELLMASRNILHVCLHSLATWQKTLYCSDHCSSFSHQGASICVPRAAKGDEELYEVLTAVKGIGEITQTSESPALAVTTSLSIWQARLLW